MVNATQGSDMDLNSEDNQFIPGGEQKTIPEDPSLATESSDQHMGCINSKTTSQLTNNVQENDSNQEHGQQKIDKYFPPTSGGRSTSPKRQVSKNDAHPKKKKPYESDNSTDDDDERQTSSMGTRSKQFSRLSIQFNDTDDEEESKSRYHSWSKQDITEYRTNYPNVRDNLKSNTNYEFYTNKICSHPDGDFIDNIHKNWFGQYRKLEYHHGYIQWLFPIQEKGLNWSADPLQKHEIELIKKDPKALERLLKSYKLMLDFYGFELKNKKTGRLCRSEENYKECFRNLNTSSHNYLRITRILKCLGEFDYEYLKFGFLAAILQEAITENTLPNCLRSCKDYWIETLRSKEERRAIRRYATELIEYRNKGIQPPSEHIAVRPLPLSKEAKPDNDRMEQ